MPDATSVITGLIPTKVGVTTSLGTLFVWITIFILVLLILVGGGIGVYMLMRALQFNKKIDIYEEREGFMEWIGQDRAREIVYNLYGDSVFYMKKRKKFLPRGEKKVSRRKYLYGIRKDGEWVNFGLESLDNKLQMAGVKFIHPDMRGFKSGVAKIIKDRFEKKSMLKEWIPIVIPLVFFIVISIALYFIVDRIVASQNNLLEVIKVSGEVMDKAREVLAATNNICTGGAGYS